MTRWFSSVLILGTATACSGEGLDGEWVGEADCDYGEVDLTARLERQGRGDHGGELDWSMLALFFTDQEPSRLDVNMEIDLSVTSSGALEQALDYQAVLRAVVCQLTITGEVASRDCSELGFGDSEGSMIDLGRWTWDGRDTIELSDNECLGTLRR